MIPGHLSTLQALFPPGVAISDPTATEKYRHDYTRDRTAGTPLAVVRAETAEQVQSCLRWANEHGVPVVPRGAGTGLAGGATAVDGGIVLSLERMRSVEIDPISRVATVEPGALNVEIKDAAAEQGLWYPPDPASFRMSTIGGNVATNAGGLCCVKYGVTVDYVLGLDVVLANGTLLQLGGRTLKDVAGLSLVKLFVGSEGTLGVVTRIHLRLVPLPAPPATMVAVFPTLRSAGEAVVNIGRRVSPSMLELMDRALINAIEDHSPMGLDRGAAAMLIGQSNSSGLERGREVDLMGELCTAAGASEVHVTHDEQEGEMFVEARRAGGPALEVRGSILTEDVAVPIERLPDLLDSIASIAAEHDVEIPVAAHAGDGNVHPAVIYTAGDDAHVERAHAAFNALLRAALACEGTITGEHGVGRMKAHMLPTQVGPDVLDISLRIKAALDCNGILNPGAVFSQ